MYYFCVFVDWFNVERVKAIAAIIQACGVVVAAVLAFCFAKILERHKYDMKRKEINYTIVEKRRLEILENISDLMGKLLAELRVLNSTWEGNKSFVEKMVGESREDWLRRHYAKRQESFKKIMIELFHTCESGHIYIPDDLYARLEEFRKKPLEIIDYVVPKMLEPVRPGDYHEKVDTLFMARCEKLNEERDEIIKMIVKIIQA